MASDISRSSVLLTGPEDDEFREPLMRFRLYYEGELRPTQGEPKNGQQDPLALHKQKIRREFHRQLKQLWATNRFLRDHKLPRNSKLVRPYLRDPGSVRLLNNEQAAAVATEAPMAQVIADAYQENGYRFVPLVRDEISLLCSLKILFLRRDGPGSVIQAGDIDNRVKTIIDTLRRPRNALELRGSETPGEGENPFFVLLEDDKQVTHLEVETDLLLDPITDADTDQRKARVVITVELRPYDITLFNLSFA